MKTTYRPLTILLVIALFSAVATVRTISARTAAETVAVSTEAIHENSVSALLRIFGVLGSPALTRLSR